jgi:dTDP-glucose 4,6-dehydratase
MKTALITGSAGFIGHHLVRYLLEKTDWNLVCLDRLDFSGDINRLHEILEDLPSDTKKRVKILYHDLKAAINPLLSKKIGNVDFILHLAAGSHVDRSIDEPMEFIFDNTIGTANLLEYAKTIPELELFVYFSTDEVFGPAPEGVKYKENDRYNSTNPYSASKAAAEELVVAYENTYGLPAIITHTMNVFGERQHPEKYIPKCISKVLKEETITIHSNKEKTKAGSRHYIHAQDVADAVYFLCQNFRYFDKEIDFGGAKCQKFNIVGAVELDNLQLAEKIASVIGKPLNYKFVDFHSSRPGHDLRYALSGEKMKRLGWEPRPIDETIKEVVNWTLQNKRWIL